MFFYLNRGCILGLALPADVDILAESDNPTLCGWFHCNARSPLQVMQCRSYIRFPAWRRDVVFLHRFHEPFCHSITLGLLIARCCGTSDSKLSIMNHMFSQLCANRYLSATAGWTVPVLYRQSVFYRSNIIPCTCRFIMLRTTANNSES